MLYFVHRHGTHKINHRAKQHPNEQFYVLQSKGKTHADFSVPGVPSGSLWFPLPPSGSLWLPLVPSGSLRFPLVPSAALCCPLSPLPIPHDIHGGSRAELRCDDFVWPKQYPAACTHHGFGRTHCCLSAATFDRLGKEGELVWHDTSGHLTLLVELPSLRVLAGVAPYPACRRRARMSHVSRVLERKSCVIKAGLP